MNAPPVVRTGVIGTFVDRPVMSAMLALSLVVIGVIAFARLPLRFLPDGMTDNVIRVHVPLPGRQSPEETRETVLRPLEQMLRTISGLERLRSNANSDSAFVRIALTQDMDPGLAAAEIRDRIQRAMVSWPRGVDRYFLWKEDGSSSPLAFVQFLTPERNSQWDHLLDNVVKPRLEAVEGVGRVQIWGARDERLCIWFDRDKLLAAGLRFGEVVARLGNDNFSTPAGELEVDDRARSFLVRVDSKWRSTGEIETLPLRPGLLLRDVATVEREARVRDELARYNQQYTYTGIVYAGSDSNPVATSDQLRNTCRTLEGDPSLPGLQVRFLFDQGQFIRDGLDTLVSSALQGGLLALGVLWLFLRNTGMALLIGSAIPMTLLATGAYMFFAGDSLDICTMAGMTLAVGMVVDNSVVVLENIKARRDRGEPLRSASIAGAREIALAVTISTLTTVVVFLPLMFLSHPASRVLMGAVGRPLSAALLASLLIALLLLPAAMRLLRGAPRPPGAWRLSPVQGLIRVSDRLLDFGLRRRPLAVFAGLLVLLSSILAFRQLDLVGSDIDPFQRGEVSVHFSFPRGYDLQRAEQQFKAYEEFALQHRDDWNLEGVGGRFGRENGRLELYLRDKDPELTAALRTKVLAAWPQVPGVRVHLGDRSRGSGGMGNRVEEQDRQNFVVRLYGRDSRYLLARALAVQEALAARSEVQNVEVPAVERRQEVVVGVDRERLQDLGIAPEQLFGTMTSGLQGRDIGRFEESGRELRVLAQFDARQKPGMLELKNTEIAGRGGAFQRLGDLGTVGLERALDSIESQDGRVQVTVIGRRAVGITAGAMTAVLQQVMSEIPLARGYSWGEDSGRREATEQLIELLQSMLLSIVLVFLLMAILFESLILPLSILVTIPFALFGASWSLFLFCGAVDPMAMIGMVILCGIVVNNGIVLLDQIEKHVRAGESVRDAIHAGVRTRLRPVLMTATTTFVGLLPMAVFGDGGKELSYVGLSIAVAGGLLCSTVLTAVSVPLAYTLARDFAAFAHRAFARGRALLG